MKISPKIVKDIEKSRFQSQFLEGFGIGFGEFGLGKNLGFGFRKFGIGKKSLSLGIGFVQNFGVVIQC